MRVLGILALVTLVGVGTAVGVRLLRLARRGGEMPERALGAGLVLVTCGGAVAAVSRAPGLVATRPGDALLGGGLLVAMCGLAFFYVFTWLVFRPRSLGALALVLLASGAFGVEWHGLMRASVHGGPTMEAILPHTRPWGVAIIAMVQVSFVWTAVESWAYWSRLRRRASLGLGDPIVTNRFLLWSISGVAVALLCAGLAGSMLAGLAPMRHPLPLGTLAATALVTSATWTLTFAPPRRYRAWLEARAAARQRA